MSFFESIFDFKSFNLFTVRIDYEFIRNLGKNTYYVRIMANLLLGKILPKLVDYCFIGNNMPKKPFLKHSEIRNSESFVNLLTF